MSNLSPNQNCSCGSSLDLAACCLPVIQGKRQAKTAEELLRARYTAFTRGDVDFIIDTHHSRTKSEVNRDEITQWSKGSKWLGLQIVQKEAGEAGDTKGTIVFCAKYSPQEDKPQDHWEQSYFEREDGQWKFLDAQGVQVGPYRRTEPKVGRNDPCACGSGKKHKKCCGN